MKHKNILILLLLTAFATVAKAQCTFRNTAFQSGEYLHYNLYYNWKLIWVKAGTASMSTIQSSYNGIPAYRTSLTTRGNNKVDNFFVLRDTLLAYSSTAMAPLYFRKGAKEGDRYYVDEVFYSYPNGNCQVKQHRLRHTGEHQWKQNTYNDCVYDMLNIFMRARSFDPVNWKKGNVVPFPIVDGDSRNQAQIKYFGKVNIKADNGHTYRCLQLAYMEKEDGKFRRIVDFYVTDDANHIPVRLDMFLKFGSAKAFLVTMKGLRNEVGSLVK